MPDLDEKVQEYIPEETLSLEETPLPIVEEPIIEGERLEKELETEVEKVVEEVLEEPETTPSEPPTDFRSMYENEKQRYDNLLKLAGGWGRELGEVRKAKQVVEPMNPEQAIEEFQKDPIGFVRKITSDGQQALLPEVKALRFLVSHPDWLDNGNLKPEIKSTIDEVEAEMPWITDPDTPNQFQIYDMAIKSKLLQKKIGTEVEKSTNIKLEQQKRTLLAKKNAKLAPVTGTKTETPKKPLADMSVEELEKVLPKSDRPLGWVTNK